MLSRSLERIANRGFSDVLPAKKRRIYDARPRAWRRKRDAVERARGQLARG